MSTTTYDITDEQWERIKGMLPLERTGKPGRPCGTSNRIVIHVSSLCLSRRYHDLVKMTNIC